MVVVNNPEIDGFYCVNWKAHLNFRTEIFLPVPLKDRKGGFVGYCSNITGSVGDFIGRLEFETINTLDGRRDGCKTMPFLCISA